MPDSAFISYRRDVWLWALLAAVLAALACIQCVTPIYGDDLTYLTFGSDQNWRGAVVRHWDWLNGRLPNLLLALSVRYLPHAAVSILAAATTVALMWLLICMCLRTCRPAPWAAVVLLTVILLAFPWWDDFLMLAVEYNYVLASLFGLLYLRLQLRRSISPGWMPAAMAVAGAAGCMHEAQSAAILAGLAAYAVVAPRRVFLRQGLAGRLLLLGCFIVGAGVTLSSPALFRAVTGGSGITDGPWYQLLLCSCPIAVALVAAVVALYIYYMCRGAAFGRTLPGRLLRTDWIVYAVAAVASMCVVAFAGVIGRSGWFGNTFALIALVRLGRAAFGGISIGERWRNAIALTLSILILAHLAAWAVVQTRLGRETELVREAYERSSDGLVYSDAVLDRPTHWYLLGKAVTMPLPGQFFKTYTFSRYYGSASRPLLVLPLSMAPGAQSVPPPGWTLVDELPSGASRQIYPHYGRTRVMVRADGGISAIDSAATRGYLISPWPNDLTINNIARTALRDTCGGGRR